jgi:hypothetical protein
MTLLFDTVEGLPKSVLILEYGLFIGLTPGEGNDRKNHRYIALKKTAGMGQVYFISPHGI